MPLDRSDHLITDALLTERGLGFFSSLAYRSVSFEALEDKNVSQLWLPPDLVSVRVYAEESLIALDRASVFNEMNGSDVTHVLSAYPVGQYVVWIMIERDVWRRALEQAQALGPQVRTLALLDLWLWQQTRMGGRCYYDNGSYAYVYGCDQRGLYRNQLPSFGRIGFWSDHEMQPPTPVCVCAHIDPPEPSGSWFEYFLALWIGLVIAGACFIAALHVYRMVYLPSVPKDVASALAEPRVRHRLNRYFKDVMDPLTDVAHPNSFIEQMIFRPLNGHMLLIGSIQNTQDLEAWLSVRAHAAYCRTEASMLERNSEIQALFDAQFSVSTDHPDETMSVLLLEDPKMFSAWKPPAVRALLKQLHSFPFGRRT